MIKKYGLFTVIYFILIIIFFVVMPPIFGICITNTPEVYLSTLSLAIAPFLIMQGLIEYSENLKWKKAEFVAKEVKEFISHPKVVAVLQMIDWSERYIDIYQDKEKKEVKVTHLSLAYALRYHKTGPIPYSRDEQAIRDLIDFFFDRLTIFEHYINAELITANDLKFYFKYWFDYLGKLPEWNSPTFSEGNILDYKAFLENFKEQECTSPAPSSSSPAPSSNESTTLSGFEMSKRYYINEIWKSFNKNLQEKIKECNKDVSPDKKVNDSLNRSLPTNSHKSHTCAIRAFLTEFYGHYIIFVIT